MKPTLGRTVHYVAPAERGGEEYAGIITRVLSNTRVDLVTFGSVSIYHNLGVEFSELPTPGCWHWPERV